MDRGQDKVINEFQCSRLEVKGRAPEFLETGEHRRMKEKERSIDVVQKGKRQSLLT